VARGELRDDVDLDAVADLVFAALQARSLSGRPPLRRREAAALVDIILQGAAPRSA
jgi:hypothetical protein